MKYLHFSVFYGNKFRHGGVKRSEQLSEILNKCQHIYSTNPYSLFRQALKSCLVRPFIWAEASFFFFYLFALKGLTFKSWLKFSAQAVNPIALIKKHQPDIIYLETAPGISLALMQYLKWKNINYIAIPHNIEFMVPCQDPSGFRSLAYAFECEIDGYRAADSVKVICDFDRSLLACLRVDSEVLPYYPTEDEERFCLDIRNQRNRSDKKEFLLLLGSTSNTPTYNGMLSFIREFSNKKSPYSLFVAGYGSDQFSEFRSQKVHILGSINKIKLKELLISCTALIIHQPQTTGFLTKIVEFNLCGIPILITSDYAQADHLEDYGIVKTNLTDCRIVQASKFFPRSLSNTTLNQLI